MLVCGDRSGCDGLRVALEGLSSSVDFVADVGHQEALKELQHVEPAVVIVGVDEIGDPEFALLRALVAARPESKLVILCDDGEVATLVRVCSVPAQGYLPWRMASRKFLPALIDTVLAGGWVGDAAVHCHLVDGLAATATESVSAPSQSGTQSSEPTAIRAALTPREQAVLALLRLGYKQREIAEALHVSAQAVQLVVREMKRNTWAATAAELLHKTRHVELPEELSQIRLLWIGP
jgi:DNA-binding NarL/FixJ family response regulator